MSEPFVGEVRLLPYTFAPDGWALCNGQLLSIAQNPQLYSVLGTIYGGNASTNFALPNLQGCVVVGAGQAPGLQPWDPGMREGSDSVTLLYTQLPAHNHVVVGVDQTGTTGAPDAASFLAQDRRGGSGNVDFMVPGETAVDAPMDPQAIGFTGGTEPHENRQPFLVLNYCIAIKGIFPPRP